MQRSMLKRNSGLSHERRIDVRIGINLGDVIVEDGDRHGDTINLTARLQQSVRLIPMASASRIR
jgi:adenylate cyclase